MELQQIVDRIMRNGGWELYHHATGRDDLNDMGTNDCYVRAHHNVRNQRMTDGLGSYIKILTDAEYCSSGKPTEDAEVVMYGKLPSEKTIAHLVVNSSSEQEAYFARLDINAIVLDRHRRDGSNPVLTIVADRESVNQLIDYLKNNPNDYYSVIRMLVPDSKYPQVNKGILQEAKPASRIILLDMDTVTANMEKDLPSWDDILKENGDRWNKMQRDRQQRDLAFEEFRKAADSSCPTSNYADSPAVQRRYGFVVQRV